MSEKATYEELKQRIQELEQVINRNIQAEETLKASEVFFRDMVEKLPFPVAVGTADHKTEYTNPKFEETFGYTAEDIPDQKAWREKFFPDPVYRAEISSEVDSWLAGNDTKTTYDRRYTDKWGLAHDIVVEVLNLKDRFYNILIDITDRKQVEERLKKSETLLNDTGQMAKVGGWELDAKTLEITWTEEIYRIYEVPFDQKPSLEEAVNFFHPDDRPKLETAIQKALDHGEPYDMEIRLITAKGKHLWTHTICRPITVNGKTIKLTGTFQDITEQKQIEREREDLIKNLNIALDDVKELRGIIPICSHCKKIRDDKGAWDQLENYISERSDAQFSHGICPECANTLYPDLHL